MTPEQAYYKAENLGKRIPKLEPIICKNAFYSYCYAIDIIKGRWELAEPNISKNAQYSYYYARNVIKGRFILSEPAISQDAYFSYYYATDIIKGKLPDFMHNQLILENDRYTKQYIEFISKNLDSLNNI